MKDIKKVESVKEHFARLDKERKKHPIRNWCYRKFWQLVRLPGEIKLGIKTFIQRGKRGWSVSDTWSFDFYLAKVISEGLKHFKKYKNGHPILVCDKNGKINYNNIDYKANEEKWDKILDKMIYTFETAKKILDNYPENDWLYCPINEWDKLKDVRDRLSSGKLMKVMTKEECLAYEEGHKLFAKHFFSLWD